MKYLFLGKTGLKVSRVGMGGIPLTRPAEKNVIATINRAIDLGINFIDTAIGYGISENRIGRAIADRRDQVILTTKGWSADHIDFSLKRLNTDFIDLWQFHGINSIARLNEVLDKNLKNVIKAKDSGKIGHIGFSSHSLKVSLKAIT